MRAILMFLLLGSIATSGLTAEWSLTALRAMEKESGPAATAALSTLRELVDEETAAPMGFRDLRELKASKLATPLPDLFVPLTALREYQDSRDPATLLQPSGEMLYPVIADGAVRSSVTVKQQDGAWKAVSFGSPLLSKALDSTRTAILKKAPGTASTDVFAVRIPALNLVFVGHFADKTLMLTPVADTPELKLRAAVTEPARDVFLRLKPVAEAHDGLPR
jgi:hypothetical protein